MRLKPAQLIVRCFAEREGNQWIACSLELGLAAQADSFPKAKQKLENQIFDYIKDALGGDDKQFAEQLLERKAPMWAYVRYYYLKTRIRSHMLANDMAKVFKETMPVRVALAA